MRTQTYTIPLPYTRPPISANSRYSHWSQRAKDVKNLRLTACLLARHHKLPKDADHAVIALYYTPRDKRRRDPSNMMPTQKALIDGLVQDYKLLPDDCSEFVTERMPSLQPVDRSQRKSRLTLEIELEWR